MEALSRFFQNKTFSLNSTSKGQKNSQKTGSRDSFGPDDVRLVVFRDHDLKGRSLIFDSKVIHRIGDGQSSCRRKSKDNGTNPSPCSTGQPPPEGAKHTPMRQLSDTNMIGEMMFGAVAMAYKGSTLKIHTIRSPPQVIITKIFVPVKAAKDTATAGDSESFDNGSYQSTTSSIYTYENSTPRDVSSGSSGPHSAPVMSQSVPMAVPSPPPPRSLEDIPAADTGDSGIAGSVTSSYSSHTTPYPSPGSSCSTGSNSYLHRRFTRSQNTSLELHVRTKLSDDAIEKPLPASKRPPQYGVGIVFNMPEDQEEKNRHFQSFLFSHVMLIEGHVNKLRLALEKALKGKGFHIATLEGLEVFRQSVFDLYLAPRLSDPVWLCMMSGKLQKVTLCKTFLKEFMNAVDKYNSKSTKMFLSTLITAVLRHHLAWVPTVAPAGGEPSRTYLDKHSAKWLDALAKSHPYNPLWAQLGDLYGAIGFPLRLSRTMVIGKKQDVIKRFLYILSYFIRCSEVYETVDHIEELHLDSLEEKMQQRRSSEISIPQCIIGESKEGSIKSPNSVPGLYHHHASFTSCSQCGSVIENPNHRNGSHVSRQLDFGTHSPVSQHHHQRKNSFHRIKSPSPVFESGMEDKLEFDRTRVKAYFKYKNNRSVNPAVTKASCSPAANSAGNFDSLKRDDRCSDVSDNREESHPALSSNNYEQQNYTNVPKSERNLLNLARKTDVEGTSVLDHLSDSEHIHSSIENISLTCEQSVLNDETLDTSDCCYGDYVAKEQSSLDTVKNPSMCSDCQINVNTAESSILFRPALFYRQFEVDKTILDKKESSETLATKSGVDTNCIHNRTADVYTSLNKLNNTDIPESDVIQNDSKSNIPVKTRTKTCKNSHDSVETDENVERLESANSARSFSSMDKQSSSVKRENDVANKAPISTNTNISELEDDNVFTEDMYVVINKTGVEDRYRLCWDSYVPEGTSAGKGSATDSTTSTCAPRSSSKDSSYNLYPDIAKIMNNPELLANHNPDLHTGRIMTGDPLKINISNATLYPDLKPLKKQEGLATPEGAPTQIFPSGSSRNHATISQATETISTKGCHSNSKHNSGDFPDKSVEAKDPIILDTHFDDKIEQTETKLFRVKLCDSFESGNLCDVMDTKQQDSDTKQPENDGCRNYKVHKKRKEFEFKMDSFSEGRKCQLSPIAEPDEECKVERVRFLSRESAETGKGDILEETTDSTITANNHINTLSSFKVRHRDSGLGADVLQSSDFRSLERSNDSNIDDSSLEEQKSLGTKIFRTEETNRNASSNQIDSGIFEHNSYDGYTNICIENETRKTANNNSKETKVTALRKSVRSSSKMYERSISADSQSSFVENYSTVACPDMQELDKFMHCVQEQKVSIKPKFQRMVSGSSEFNEYFHDDSAVAVKDKTDSAEKIIVYDLVNNSTNSTGNTNSDKQPLAGDSQNNFNTSSSTNGSIIGFPIQTQNNNSNKVVTYLQDETQDSSSLLPQEIDKSILLDRIEAQPAEDSDSGDHHHHQVNLLTMSGSSQGSDDLEGSLNRDRYKSNEDLGVSRGRKAEELCSTSMTGSDMTDVEGSLCSECTLRTERSSNFSTAKQRRAAYRRTASMPSSGTPGRCRSVTPTELSRRRHASALSINTLEAADVMETASIQTTLSLEHMDMPSTGCQETKEQVVPQERNFGHSLLAGYSSHYLSDFTLHGTSDTSFHTRLHQDLMMSVQKPVLDEHITETACVIADTDKWSVKVLSCHYNASDRVQTQEVVASKLVSDIIDSVYNLWKLKMSPEFCLMHLEDRLQEVYFKSKMLSEYMKINRKTDLKEIAAMLGFDPSDLPLLLAVAGTHTPTLVLGLIS